MYATDFLFDNQRASDFGLMICSFNGDFETASGGEIEYNVVKTPGSDTFTFYGAQMNSVITWNFSICKNPYKNNNMYFDQYEESMITKWLVKPDGYRWIQFEQEGYEDIFYHVCISMTPRQVAGRTVGFDLVATSDCAYGFTDVIKKKGIISKDTPLKLNVHSDINTYIFPLVIVNGEGNFNIKNENDNTNKKTWLYNVSKTDKIIMDSDNDIIKSVPYATTGKTEELFNPNDFNWYFLRLVDGMNVITTDSAANIDIEIQYREPRYVRV